MKKLTKGLSLVLVLAMVLSLLSVTAFAGNSKVDYTDADEFTYGATAIDVLTGLGVFNGFEDGAFQPDGSFTREQAAKIITYLVDGPTAAAALTAKASGYTDVAEDRWSSPFVRFGTERGIIAGYGNDTFGPEDTLTREQWLKMLLTAIGYDAEACGLVGEYWAENTTDLALTCGLIDDDQYKLPFNRETAALYAYNALEKPFKTVYYSKTNADGSVTKAYKAELSGSDLNEKNFGAERVANYGIWMRPEGTTVNDGKDVIAWKNAEKTYTTEVDLFDALVNDFGVSKTAAAKANFTVYEDGKEVAATEKVGGNGCVTEIYDMGGGNYTVVVIHTYVKVLGPTDIHAETKTKDAYIDLNDGVTYVTDAFKPGDVVLYNYSNVIKAAVNVHAASAVNGKITAIDVPNQKLTLDSKTTYELGHKDHVAFELNNSLLNTNTYAVYLDDYGYAVYAKKVELKTNMVFVLATAADNSYGWGSESNLFERSGTALAQAKVLNLDGTIEVLDIATQKAINYPVSANATMLAAAADSIPNTSYNNNYYYTDKNGYASATPVRSGVNLPIVRNEAGELVSLQFKFAEYIELDGGVVFTNVLDTLPVNYDPMADKTAFYVNGAEKHLTKNSSVTVISVHPDNSAETTVATYTGYEAVPKISGYTVAFVDYDRDELDKPSIDVKSAIVVKVEFAKPELVYLVGENDYTDTDIQTTWDRNAVILVKDGVKYPYEQAIRPYELDLESGVYAATFDPNTGIVVDLEEVPEGLEGEITDYQGAWIQIDGDQKVFLDGATVITADGMPYTISEDDQKVVTDEYTRNGATVKVYGFVEPMGNPRHAAFIVVTPADNDCKVTYTMPSGKDITKTVPVGEDALSADYAPALPEGYQWKGSVSGNPYTKFVIPSTSEQGFVAGAADGYSMATISFVNGSKVEIGTVQIPLKNNTSYITDDVAALAEDLIHETYPEYADYDVVAVYPNKSYVSTDTEKWTVTYVLPE